MRTVLTTIALAVLCLASPAAAQPACIDLCSILPNCGFEDGFEHWTCTRPNGNYKCPPPSGPELNVPSAIVPGPDGPFAGVLNPNDGDIAGKLVHDAAEVPGGTTQPGTCFEVKVWANRGRLPGSPAAFAGAGSQVLVRIFGWTEGAHPVIDPATDDWSRRPNATSCALVFPFPKVGSEGHWLSQVLRCTITPDPYFVSLSIAGVNHSHGSYVSFDLTEVDFVP